MAPVPLLNVRKKLFVNGTILNASIWQFLLLLAFIVIKIHFADSAGCSRSQFECKDGYCISKSKRCDGRSDCSDNSDEIGCDLEMCRKPNWFQCVNGPCISSALICNGIENCPGGEDEQNCNNAASDLNSSKSNCTKYEYVCQADRSCIRMEYMCDGVENCSDGSDEVDGCLQAERNCKGFFCKNKRCLSSSKYVCNGNDDCGDYSDEQDCAKNCTPEMDKFLCSNNITCLSLYKVCDGILDCPDGTDESSRCTASNNCKNKTCPTASKCQMMPQSGPECICPKGFKYSLLENVCVDIDECLEQYGVCSQICVNAPGTYRCTCDEGYTLTKDNHTCKAINEEPLLLYTTLASVMAVNLRSNRVYTIAKNLKDVIGVSSDIEHIYWTNLEYKSESIVKANLDGSEQNIIITSGLKTPEDLAVDWLTGNIYFSDNGFQCIAVCSNDGLYCTVLVTDNVEQPRGVALWPQRSQLFWTDLGSNPMIGRASMDGTNYKHLVTKNMHSPNSIALDIHNDRLYWVDAKLNTIESVRTDGMYRTIILQEIPNPYGLDIFEDNIYWSDRHTKSIHTCNKFTGKDHRAITKDSTIYAVHIYHSSKQEKIAHACKKSRCSHLCLLAEKNSYSCACPSDMKLGPDLLRCIYIFKKSSLFLGAKRTLLEMKHPVFGRHVIKTVRKLNMIIQKMAYNSVNNTLFIVDNYRKEICEVDLENKEADVAEREQVRTLVKGNLGYVTDLAFDHLSYALYWTDAERHVVEVLSLITGHRAIVSFISGMETPISLAVIPEDGTMFIALKSTNLAHIDIVQGFLNGAGNLSRLFGNVGNENIKFATDFDDRILYWTDSALDRISYTNYRNFYANTFYDGLKKPYDIAIIRNDIFWTSLRSNNIYWKNMYGIGPIRVFGIEGNPEFNATTHSIPPRIPLTASGPAQTADHPCQHWNGGCSHVCVTLNKFDADCLCPPGLTFKEKNERERTCIKPLHCEFRCRSGECLTLAHKCNNRIDCRDGSDEEGCDVYKKQKNHVVCTVDQFKCHNGEKCLESDKRCDGKKQCQDESDEENCENFNKSKKCHRFQNVCNNGNCVDLSLLCDGINDCGDNTDEENCGLTSVCGKDMFQCNSGTCIGKSWECDGKIDCSDSSDEHDKCAIRECPVDMHKCLLGQCIDKHLVCDGHNDCRDMSDELLCDEPETCDDALNPSYQCPSASNICLPLSAKCNGINDCPRGEDEFNCGNICNIFEFRCKTFEECIFAEFRCDNEEDCADGSDEENCEKHEDWSAWMRIQTLEKPCGPKMWDCRDGNCVDESKVCDGIVDCYTQADEGPLCNTSCKPLNGKAPCENKCKATPSGAVCSCFSGYKLNSDNRSCVDINECEELDPCAQICENTHGSYRCSCYPDFMLRPDKTSCKSIESKKALLFSTNDEIRSITEEPTILKVAWKTNYTKINGFDLNIRTRQAYLTEQNENIIYKINVDTGKVEEAMDISMPGKVSVDWITGNVYVLTHSQVYEIQVCSFAAKMCGTILKVKPRDTIKTLTVDAYNRRLFYVIVENYVFGVRRSRIVIANLDGSKRAYFLTNETSFITALAYDPYNQMLYYNDLHHKTLQGISYRAGVKDYPTTILPKRDIIMHPSDLTWYENQVFIVNLGGKEVIRCFLYGLRKCERINLNLLNAENILIDGASRQPMNHNPCSMAKCQSMCVQTEFSYICMCGDSIVSDSKYCDQNNEIISSGIHIHRPSYSNDDQLYSHISGVVWSLVILLCLVLCGLGYCYYRRKKNKNGNIIRNLHFQNPLVSYIPQHGSKTDTLDSELSHCRTGSSSGATGAPFEIETQKFLRDSTPTNDTEILLEMAKPHEIHEISPKKQLQRRPEPFSLSSLLGADRPHDITGHYYDYTRSRHIPT